jgi:glutamate/tyrosine decarboxylase-like PLP-dependent enzyme
VHGTREYSDAVEATLEVARMAAEEVRRRPYLTLLEEPDLSVVIFERNGWEQSDYDAWSADLLQHGRAFVTASKHRGRPCTRFAIVNPRTTASDLRGILASMA